MTNEIVLILTLFDVSTSGVKYYKNLVNYIKLVYEDNIDVVLVINSGFDFNGDMEFREFQDYCTFGLSEINQDILYKKYSDISNDKTIITPNRGWDVGSFLIGLKHIEDQYEYVYHIHSKKDKVWRDLLLSIKDTNILKLNVDTVVSEEKYVWILEGDRNLDILSNHKDLFPHEDIKTWEYNSGKIFMTRYDFLKPLVGGFEEIYSLLTDRNKDDVFWCEHMDDKEYYGLVFSRLRNCPWNSPMTPWARNMRKKFNARNYFELLEHGYRGIPDLQIEHAIERYLGYLICLNKRVHLV